ncbi:helix-turn-helix domain-containing protein [Aggregatibacter kilianii]|jgi:similarities in the C-terminal part with transcription regulators|uniref:helix-turn-helix domain-containing protein n=1 Tax=Aggregatibacter kilianii TaxID=2025884 RepID=UPI000D64911C|nr:AraC family transcriptional regulator [Aggregatibacter kilianii]
MISTEQNTPLAHYQQLLAQVPPEWQAITQLHQINDNLLVSCLDGTPTQALQSKIQGQSSVSVSIILAGKGEVRFAQGAYLTLAPNTVVFMQNNGQVNGFNYFAANQSIRIVDFRFSPGMFNRLIGTQFNFKGKLLSDCSRYQCNEYMGKLPATLELLRIANQVLQCKMKNQDVKRLFLEAKALEVLALSLEQFHLEHQEHQLPIALDRQKLLQAQQIIQERKGCDCDIKTLCRISGLSEKKLQSGFHLLFNQSVSQYRNQIRIEHACRLLEQGEKIIQISTALGFNSPSHFAKLFKQLTGCAPKKWQLYRSHLLL